MKLEATRFWLVGASEGIGRALALSLASKGAIVAVSARSADKLEALSREADQHTALATVVCDVTSLASIQQAYTTLIQQWGVPDVIIFNAGIYTPSACGEVKLDSALATIDTNLNGMLRLWDVVREDMLARKSGRVIIVSSVAGYRGLPTSYAYGASKAALTNLTETLRIELADKGIVVQLVSPGFVDTRLTQKNDFKMPMMITPQKAADYIIKGIEKDVYEIHFPKRFSFIMKLLRILPNPLFFWIAKKGIV